MSRNPAPAGSVRYRLLALKRQAKAKGKPMPAVTRTPGYDMTDAITEAKDFVLTHPAQSSTPEARIFYHAVMDYFRELGISREDRKQIIELWVEAECSTWQKGWSQGWDSAVDAYSPPF